MVLKHISAGQHVIVADAAGYDMYEWVVSNAAVPADLKSRACVFGADGAVPVPVHLSAADVVALYTATEKARIFTSAEPNVIGLLLALQLTGGVVLGSTEHVQGTALIAGLGLLDGPDRAARIVAGEPPL